MIGALVASALLSAAAPAPAPARVQVSAVEYSFTLSRQSVKAGPAIIELLNLGEDLHDLRIQLVVKKGVKPPRTFGVAPVEPQMADDVERKLVAGSYKLWCSIGDHAARGMRATLRVTK